MYAVGDIVLFRPNWPTRPSFGIWTSNVSMVTDGVKARISGTRSDGYSVQMDRLNDGTFNDCHWPAKADEVLGYYYAEPVA